MYVRITEGNYSLLAPGETVGSVHVKLPEPLGALNIRVDAHEVTELRGLPWGDAVEEALELTRWEPLLERDVLHLSQVKEWLFADDGVDALNRAWWDRERPKLVERIDKYDARFGASLTVA